MTIHTADDEVITPARIDETVTIPVDSYLAMQAALDAGDVAVIADVMFDTDEAVNLSSPDALLEPLSDDAIRDLLDEQPGQVGRWLTAYARTVATYELDAVAHLFAQPASSIGPDAISRLADSDLPATLPAETADGLGKMLAAAALGLLTANGADNYAEFPITVPQPADQQWQHLTAADGETRYTFTVNRTDGPTPGLLAITFARAIHAWRDTDKTLSVDASDEMHAAHAAACDELADLADSVVADLLVKDSGEPFDLPATSAGAEVGRLAQWFVDHPTFIGEGSAVDNATRLLTLAYGDDDDTVDMSLVGEQVRQPDLLLAVAAGFVDHANGAIAAAREALKPPTPHNLFAYTCTRRRTSDQFLHGVECPVCDR